MQLDPKFALAWRDFRADALLLYARRLSLPRAGMGALGMRETPADSPETLLAFGWLLLCCLIAVGNHLSNASENVARQRGPSWHRPYCPTAKLG